MTDSFNYEGFVPESWRARLSWDRLDRVGRQNLGEFAFEVNTLGRVRAPAVIEEVKYGGRLVILDNDSRWEVDSLDEFTAESWGYLTNVVVINAKMYNLDDAESISVEREY